MINKILLSLFDYYRRKNDSISATFHSKALMGLFFLMVCTMIFFLFVMLLGIDTRLDNKTSSINLKLVLFGIVSVIVFILWVTTDSYDTLEVNRAKAEPEYRKVFFISFYLAIPLLIYLISLS